MIEIKNITKKYDDRVIFKNFSLKINDGEFVVITGKSGCGKSTLLNIIGLLEDPDKGKVVIDGEKILSSQSKNAVKVIRNKISYVFQNFALVDEETVKYNLMLALRYVKLSHKEKENKIADALAKVGLCGYENKKIYQLSGGEQQRVSLARVFLKPSEIILADEPTGSLDKENAVIVINILKRINRDYGKTVLIVTHDENLKEIGDRIIDLS